MGIWTSKKTIQHFCQTNWWTATYNMLKQHVAAIWNLSKMRSQSSSIICIWRLMLFLFWRNQRNRRILEKNLSMKLEGSLSLSLFIFWPIKWDLKHLRLLGIEVHLNRQGMNWWSFLNAEWFIWNIRSINWFRDGLIPIQLSNSLIRLVKFLINRSVPYKLRWIQLLQD